MSKKKLVQIERNYREGLRQIPNSNPYKSFFRKQGDLLNGYLKDQPVQIHVRTSLPSGEIKLSQVNAILPGMAKIVNSVFNKLYGNGKDTGKIPKSILTGSDMVIRSVRPGSFVINIGSPEAPQQLSLDHSFKTWNDFLSEILNISVQSNEKKNNVFEIANKFGYRTFNASKSWFSSLDRNNISLIYKDKKNDLSVDLDNKRLHKIVQQFYEVKLTHRINNILVNGKILEVNAKRRIILLGDQQLERTIKILISDNSLNGASININEKVYSFRVREEIISNHETGKDEYSYTMTTFKDQTEY